MEVIGAGLGRTGTMSLKLALEQLLDAPCHHMFEVFQHPEQVPVWRDAAAGKEVDWNTLFQGYQAAVDWPSCAFAVELSRVYPQALILLSVRDFESWWNSASNTIFPSIDKAEGEWRDMIETLFTKTFTFDLTNKDACHEAFDRHYAKVRSEIPAERILEWRAGDGWEPICARLDLPVPDEPFPHRNTTEEFRNRRQAAQE
ncbi:MAG: sulfotransferase [Gammaproteobacteria bacterium]|nr:hypothetical protein [Pseudomonadales bacterium]MCP5347145.1 sulfotransferase family protein [Pseudomonadales bacterium]